jgi:hypothetical protein
MAGGLRTGGEQQREEGIQLDVGELRRLQVGQRRVHDDGEHVVGGLGPLRSDEVHAVLEHPHATRRLAVRAEALVREPDVALAHVEAGVEELAQPVAVVLRHAEQDADGLQRQLPRHVGHEVERRAVLDLIEEDRRAAPQLLFEDSDRAGCEAGAHEPTDASVARVVHHRQDHPCDLEVLEQGAAVETVAAALGGVGGRVELHRLRLGVGGHRPEPLAPRRVRGGLVPVHGRLAPVLLEDVVREPVGEPIEVGQVDPGHGGDGAHGGTG